MQATYRKEVRLSGNEVQVQVYAANLDGVHVAFINERDHPWRAILPCYINTPTVLGDVETIVLIEKAINAVEPDQLQAVPVGAENEAVLGYNAIRRNALLMITLTMDGRMRAYGQRIPRARRNELRLDDIVNPPREPREVIVISDDEEQVLEKKAKKNATVRYDEYSAYMKAKKGMKNFESKSKAKNQQNVTIEDLEVYMESMKIKDSMKINATTIKGVDDSLLNKGEVYLKAMAIKQLYDIYVIQWAIEKKPTTIEQAAAFIDQAEQLRNRSPDYRLKTRFSPFGYTKKNNKSNGFQKKKFSNDKNNSSFTDNKKKFDYPNVISQEKPAEASGVTGTRKTLDKKHLQASYDLEKYNSYSGEKTWIKRYLEIFKTRKKEEIDRIVVDIWNRINTHDYTATIEFEPQEFSSEDYYYLNEIFSVWYDYGDISLGKPTLYVPFFLQRSGKKLKPIFDFRKVNELYPIGKDKIWVNTEAKIRELYSISLERNLKSIWIGDLSAAYNQIMMPVNSIGFKWNNKDFIFNIIPYGWNNSPRIFTLVLNEIIKKIINDNILFMNFYDDILIFSQNKDATNEFVKALKEYFIINDQKSEFITKATKYCGYNIDFQNNKFMMKTDPKPLNKKNIVKARQSLNGFLGWNTMFLFNSKLQIMKLADRTEDVEVIDQLQKWAANHYKGQEVDIVAINGSYIIYCDASPEGYAIVICNTSNKVVKRLVFARQASFISNEQHALREAIILAEKEEWIKKAKICSDNSTAVARISSDPPVEMRKAEFGLVKRDYVNLADQALRPDRKLLSDFNVDPDIFRDKQVKIDHDIEKSVENLLNETDAEVT